ncbi:PAS domain S-box-containing protein/diguanylate cyclase (GGDEF)-like protein [Aminobacter aminovorans]|uniref:Bacteriophytochrome cph2 n=1 Tax=Aminobacter aminovorans TaxID=83263 RepID=A0A380WEY8_AMIAI|nr:PAS domain S-box-containing protein/diguanylate cyclase (GGDEF)-like protein [Aminobacter aminovorans]SUU87278.1 Bacteriophytochrome cph2 [Aminobacter aminovorans]
MIEGLPSLGQSTFRNVIILKSTLNITGKGILKLAHIAIATIRAGNARRTSWGASSFAEHVTRQRDIRSKFQLLGLLWPFIAVVLIQTVIAGASLYTLSAVRAYAAGESAWSKGHKDAIYYLTLYADSGDAAYFERFRNAIAVPLADRDARLAMEKPLLDYDAAYDGFIRGGNHPNDNPGLIWLFKNFRHVPYLSNAVDRWIDADPKILEIAALGEAMHDGISTDKASEQQLAAWKDDIHRLHEETAPLAEAFSVSLGRGSRDITVLLLCVNVVTAAALILLAMRRTGNLLEQRRAFESALNAERERAQITLASIGQAVVATDADGRLDYMNEAAETMLDWHGASAKGKPLDQLFRLVSEESDEEDDGFIARVLAGEAIGGSGVPQQLMRPDLSSVAVSLVAAPLYVDGKVAGAVLVFHDRTKEQEFMAQLSWQATHDTLTSLANRREFEARLNASLAALAKRPAVHALMYLDLDQFKIVNDTCGHAAGDELLRKVSAALHGQLRPTDLLARLGGDEFGILLENCPEELAADTAEGLRKSVDELNFVWAGRAFKISVSIGVVGMSDASMTLEEILRSVDVACYMAKERGRNRIQIQQIGDMEVEQRLSEMAWVQRLREALEQNRFRIFAQEIVPLHGDAAVGAHIELLVRLADAEGKLIAPGEFIPAAERYGLMPLIDRWMVRQAFGILARQSADSTPITTCAINLSGTSFGDDSFADFVLEQFARTGISPDTICFEITETSAIADLDRAARFITTLQEHGCRFSLDDFGSGMSSFSYLKALPVDYLKIDGGFVKDMLVDRIDRAMVEMIQHIGEVTGKRTIAEFVENDDIARVLRDIGVDYAQGFGIARPRPFGEHYVGIKSRSFEARIDTPDVALAS